MNVTDMSTLAFMGRITESVSIDLRNVLATVKENAELLEDLLSVEGGAGSPAKKRVSHILSAIKEQVVRGVDLAALLDAFSGGPEKRATEMDLYELLSMLVRICEPMARFTGVTLKIIQGDKPLIVLGKPLEIQMALFDCVDFLVNSMGARGTVNIRGDRRGEEEIMVSFLLPEHPEQTPGDLGIRMVPDRWDTLKERVKRVNGSLMAGRTPVRFALVLRNEFV